ncbi:sugar ABC transporter ATP-binding protein [Aerococcaceae bacterium DSM 111020]|nr:sugar ABC transporter ATP-binding protein [Aerococcaceae bacterium DSM 111020]
MEIKMKGITKAFGNNQVLSGVDFHLLPGEVHALMGENGAGKSTLMNILTGLVAKDDGSIIIGGQEKSFDNPKIAEDYGISFIHQELTTWPEMTVLENIFLGKEITNSFGLCDNSKMMELAESALAEIGVHLDLNRPMKTLSVGQQQLVEIGKTLLNDAKVIIMDEPTAALTGREIDLLFEVIEKLTKNNVSIVYISHRMSEIFQISDRITVMRDGVSVSTEKTSETNNDIVVRQMVGRDLEDYYPDIDTEKGSIILEVENLTSDNVFDDISFSLRSGEILGVSGLMGAGRTEIMRAIFCLDNFESGTIKINGKKESINNPEEAISKGIGFLTEDRKEEGLILDFSIKNNISLTAFEEFSSNGVINELEENKFVDLLMERLAVKAANRNQPAGSLSGGNQQKIVLAKWVAAGTQILILDEPTRGVDVGAKREIYVLMKELAQRGVGIIMVSSDLPEIIGISDRVLVIHEGKVSGELNHNQLSEENIMTLATGGQL